MNSSLSASISYTTLINKSRNMKDMIVIVIVKDMIHLNLLL